MNYLGKILLNSLYGRFGMDDSFPTIKILDINEFNKNEDEYTDGNPDLVLLDNKIMIIYRSHQEHINTLLDNTSETHNISIPIAAAITAYARIHMSQFKNNPDFILYYSDTDSVFINKPLPKEFVNDKILGKMKLENICKDAIFLAPKVYCLLTEDNKLIYKVKGLSHNIQLSMEDFNNLLFKESFIQKIQTK